MILSPLYREYAFVSLRWPLYANEYLYDKGDPEGLYETPLQQYLLIV